MKKSLILLVCIIALSARCVAQTIVGCAPLEVKFNAESNVENNYYWDFKDGATSILQNPVNIFSKPGTYSVTLQNGTAGSLVKTIKVTVFEKPVLGFETNTVGCAPYNALLKNVTVINSAIHVNTYKWIFEDGSTVNSVSPRHTFSELRKHDFSMSIETEFQSCNVTKIYKEAIEVISPPSVSLVTSPSSTISCTDPFNVTFSTNSFGAKPLTYNWDFGNQKNSDQKDPGQQIYNKGSFTAVLKVSYKDVPGCVTEAQKSISVGKPVPEISIKKDSVCPAEFVTVKTSSPGIISWDFGSDASLKTSFKTQDSVVYFKPGKKVVKLTVTSTDRLCSASTTAEVFVDDILVKVESTPEFVCESPAKFRFKAISNQPDVTYRWIIPSLKADSIQTSEVVEFTRKSVTDTVYFAKNDIEYIAATAIITSKLTGCKSVTSKTSVMSLPNGLIRPSVTKGCAPLDVVMRQASTSSDSIVKWHWVYGDGNTETRDNKKPVSHTYTQPGEYDARIVVTTKSGCVDTSYAVKIEVGTSMRSEIDFKASKSEVCPGEPLNFRVTKTSDKIDGYHFSTDADHVFHCDKEKDITYAYNHTAGPQDVTLSVDYNGCISELTKPGLVKVKGAIAKIDYGSPCNNPLNYAFRSVGPNAQNVKWDFGDGLTSTDTHVSHLYESRGDYFVRLTAEADGCKPDTDIREVNVRKLEARIDIDTLLCFGQNYPFVASSSKDVDAACHTGYTWQFPDLDRRPHTSHNSSTDFKFDVVGLHNARLIVKDVNGCKDTAQVKFKVFNMEPVIAVSDSNICNPATVQFFSGKSAHDTSLVSWTWKITDSLLTGVNTAFQFNKKPVSGSSYPILLELEDAIGCIKNVTFSLNHYSPTSFVEASDYTLCLGTEVKLTARDFTADKSKLLFKWDFGNGQSSINQSETILYDTARNYKVRLSFTEVSSGCKGDTSGLIQIQEYPIARFASDLDTLQGCAPATSTFTDQSVSSSPISSWSWNFNNGQKRFNNSPKQEATYFELRNSYKPSLIVSTSFGCTDTLIKEYVIYDPAGDFEMGPTTICKGDTIEFKIKDTTDVEKFTWGFGDGDTLKDIGKVLHQYNFHPPSGQTIATLLMEKKGCRKTVTKPVTIHQVVAGFARLDGQDSSICFNEGAYRFTNESRNYNMHQWDFDDGTTSEEVNPLHSFPGEGVYNVTLTIFNNTYMCRDTIIKQAVVYRNPELKLKGDTACKGDSLVLEVVNPVAVNNYTWIPATDLLNTDKPFTKSYASHTAAYTVTETDVHGCADTDTVTGYIIEPLVSYNLDTTIVIGDKVKLPVQYSSLYNFSWQPSTGLSCFDCSYPEVQPLKDITYNLVVADTFKCFTTPYQYNIVVKPETFVKMPSTFTPNGDGANDKIYVKGWGIKELMEFQVFNRWGQMVFSSTDVNVGWDGSFEGKIQNSDLYVYRVKVKTWKDEVIFNEGYINLVH